MASMGANLYASCRRRTGMTQEAWAEKLDVSVESVKRYETDVRIPPLHIVKAMADLSGDESLAYRFLAKTTQELDVLPDIEMLNLQAATIRMMNRMARFAAKARDRQLMEIAEDGIISADEKPLYDEIMDELSGLVSAFYQLRYCKEESV
uniref:Helix-turn-helix domain protein n=1 Tax=Siphoviridae sp. ctY1p61 TaxID=2826373 RepID=A0A8S5NL23_9CAUD|nr:MAG TPA: helix-turn-helix domain protein [Siphoviridae sp. ctY1p61]